MESTLFALSNFKNTDSSISQMEVHLLNDDVISSIHSSGVHHLEITLSQSTMSFSSLSAIDGL